MTRAEFMFTKNFNSKVNANFSRSGSYFYASSEEQATQLVDFAQIQFDLMELSARKLRQKLYENKGVFSGVDFYKSLYDEVLKEQNERINQISKDTKLGEDRALLSIEKKKIVQEIKELANFCATCKPPKKKKKR